MANGDLSASADPILCAAIDAPQDTNAPVKLWTGNEKGQLFCHVGTPFKTENTKEIFNLGGIFINSMDFCPENKTLVLVTGDKRIITVSGETDEKLCEKENAHTKGIYDVKWISENSFMTCSSDNLVKVWKWNAADKTIE